MLFGLTSLIACEGSGAELGSLAGASDPSTQLADTQGRGEQDFDEAMPVAATPRAGADEPPTLVVDVAARVTESGTSAGWVARAAWASLNDDPTLSPGECRPAGSARGPLPRGARGAGEVAIEGPTATKLTWDGVQGAWRAEGPRGALDPAWSVRDLVWTDPKGAHRADGAVRFGGAPAVTSVTRAREGT